MLDTRRTTIANTCFWPATRSTAVTVLDVGLIEPEHDYRGPFARDRDRILHSSAFRRLSGKMQVFTGEMGIYHRTRLTHTFEVSSIARTMARVLRLNEDLTEALALVHDIGHPPFGHCGEDALAECMRDVGGFSHNSFALVIVEQLEQRYAKFPGLNLTLEVLSPARTSEPTKPKRRSDVRQSSKFNSWTPPTQWRTTHTMSTTRFKWDCLPSTS